MKVFNQLAQIKTGGPHVFCRKFKKALKLLVMSLAAPVAVYFKVDWPEAHDFLISKAFQKIKKLRSQPGLNKSLADKLIEESISYLKKNTGGNPDLSGLPDWMRRCMVLGDLHRIKNEMKEYMAVYKRVVEVGHNMAKEHQLDDLGIEFIPRTLALGSIGVYEYLEIYIKARTLELRPNKKMILLLEPHATANNPCYLKYWRKYFTVVSDPRLIEMLTPLEAFLTVPFISFVHFRGNVCQSSLIQGTVREQWNQEGRPPFFTLLQEDYERGWNCLRSLGLPQDAWFVTLHVREPGWRDGDSREENFRNADITTYIPAIKAITDASGWVVRIGDPGMSKLPAMPRVIDYAHSTAKSDWMDIFLCAQCRFMIGTSSGMCVIASAFGIPLVMTNVLPAYGVYHFTSKDLFIPRLCFSKNKEDHLNFFELMSPPVSTATGQSHFDNRNIHIIENKADEIKALVEEMLEKCTGTLQYSEEDEILQKRFRKVTADCGKLYGDLNIVSQARIGRGFLRKHAGLLPADAMESVIIKDRQAVQ